jgi:hypothetical protein
VTVRYALREIRTHWRDRQWWRKRFLSRVVAPYYTRFGGPEGDPLASLEWDTVLLLDACRYDLFETVYEDRGLPGTLGERTSLQSGTPGYLAENFAGDSFHDTVYVTANPYVETELPEDTFHAVDHVWRDAWDEAADTVRPEVVAERALDAADRYPDKRLIVHFNQPHTPFIGEEQVAGRGMGAIRQTAMDESGPDPRDRLQTPFERLGAGDLSYAEVWRAYLSNLEVAWDSVERLLTELDGLTAVTADHGNAMGEYASPFPIKVYGHPLGILIPALTRVPWHTFQNGERRTVRADPPERTDREVDADTEQRLRSLGYAE